MHTNRFWELLAKQLSGDITEEELQELNYLKGEDEFLAYNDELVKVFSSTTFQEGSLVSNNELHEKWNGLQQKIKANDTTNNSAPVKRFRAVSLFKYVAVAASLALLIFIGSKWLNQPKTEAVSKPNIVSTRNGSRSKVQMPDGTQIWLNAGSSLKYDNATYGVALREVELIGEAYFDVAKDAAHPFIIHTKAMDVKVIGTAFNIRAYPNEKQTETSLIRGKIEVSFPGRPLEKLFLKPNEKITVANAPLDTVASRKNDTAELQETESIIVLSKIDHEAVDSAVIETAWVRNKLIFRNKSFEDLAQDMERWYNVSIRFQDSSLSIRHLTGTFYNETVFEALDLLKQSSPFQYKYNKENNTITLYR
jgi:ferric-dicitrate binding protein FerR (iron transport regulator)